MYHVEKKRKDSKNLYYYISLKLPNGQRFHVRKSAGTTNHVEAEAIAAAEHEKLLKQKIYKEKRELTLDEALGKYLTEYSAFLKSKVTDYHFSLNLVKGINKTILLSDINDEIVNQYILYQLSLRYVDFYVRRIVDELKKRNMLDNTIIVLTADHGSSYTFNPVREISVNNFHKENFKTPFLVWPSNSKKPNSDAIFSAEDVLPTIFKEAGVKKPDHYKGLEMQNNLEGRKIIVTEYMGPGCPDMFDREIWMSSRSKNYMISYKMNVKNKFDRNNFFEIYDLANDPFEFKNLRLNEKIYSNNVINEMCNAVEKRFYEIIDERDSFIYNFLGTNGEKND